jgi:hypothetical protein
MRPWKFAKPKNPGFGISKRFYLSVLAARAQLPTIAELVTPDGAGGAVVGFGAPLAQGTSKEDLRRPLARGAYVLTTKDRATVLKMLVISKEEAGFDPTALLRSAEASSLNPELLARVGATWTLMQLTFESHDAMVYPALDFLLHVCRRLADLSDGAIADPLSEIYVLPEQLIKVPRVDPRVDAREHVAVHFRTKSDGLWAYTRGMQKFSLPEYEIQGLEHALSRQVESLLLSISQTNLLGKALQLGDRVGSAQMPFDVGPGGLDRAVWEGVDCYELLPPTGGDASKAVAAWAAETVGKLNA